jgi:hypothetical protein
MKGMVCNTSDGKLPTNQKIEGQEEEQISGTIRNKINPRSLENVLARVHCKFDNTRTASPAACRLKASRQTFLNDVFLVGYHKKLAANGHT